MKNLTEVIKNSNGRILTVDFVKKDGSVRTLNGRIGVKAHLKGGTKTVNNDQYLTIYDVKAQGYRSVNKDTILEVRANGEVYER